jgi:hypothetical protein
MSVVVRFGPVLVATVVVERVVERSFASPSPAPPRSSSAARSRSVLAVILAGLMART